MQSRQFTPRKTSGFGTPAAPSGFSLDACCLQIVDLGLAAILLITPLLFGGRHPVGRFVLVSLCALVAAAWFVRQAVIADGRWTRTAATGLLLLAIGVVGFQLVPLPASWIEHLAPRLATLVPLWNPSSAEGVSLGRWNTLSLAPSETRLALATLVAYGLLFITATQRLRTLKDVELVFQWIALSAIVMAVFGLVQYFASNGRFFWFYEHPFSDTSRAVTGSFICRNHFAHFLVLGTAALIAWITRCLSQESSTSAILPRSRSAQTSQGSTYYLTSTLLMISLIAVVIAVLLSFSRGGAMALAGLAIVQCAIYVRFCFISLTSAGLVFSAGLATVLVVLSFYGYEQVALRLDDFTAGSLEELDTSGGRRKIWSANLGAIRAGWQTGSGAGSHRHIYSAYLTESHPNEFTHAENGPLQVVTENGLPGGLLLLAGILCCGVWCGCALLRCKQRRERIYAGAATAALSASLIHSVVDFVWFIPACMATTIVIAAAALCLAQLQQTPENRLSVEPVLRRPAWIGLAAVVMLAGGWAVLELLAPTQASLHWDRYQLNRVANKALRNERLKQGVKQFGTLDPTATILTETMVRELREVVRLHPQDGRAHLRLARHYLRQFDLQQANALNHMSIVQIRDAAMASNFSSSRELHEWLLRAFGENSALIYRALYHAKSAIRLCPLQSEAYLHLADLCFLEGHGGPEIEAYLAQALKIGPSKGNVLFKVGMQRLLAGNLEEAVHFWSKAFRGSGNHQFQIINLSAGKLPAEVFVHVFQPDWKTLHYLWKQYREVGTEDDLHVIEQYTRNLVKRKAPQLKPKLAAEHWQMLGWFQSDLERHQAALVSFQQANQLDPDNFDLRFVLGRLLLQLGQAEAAEFHLRWCLARRPAHSRVKRSMLEAAKVRLGQASAAKSAQSL